MNLILISTSASLAVIHTAIGVDHYIPFVAMSKSNHWSFRKTMLIVLICGIGHVLSSVILGLIGIWLGSQLSFLVRIEDVRGELAKWFLIAFGALYMLWGVRNAIKNKPHSHLLADGREVWHGHKHKTHEVDSVDTHAKKSRMSRSFWPLFILLVLGPCEPLIPLIMYPATDTGMFGVIMVAMVFSICTITTMLFCTIIVLKGVNMIPMKRIERYSHALAGFAILICGLSIQFLGI